MIWPSEILIEAEVERGEGEFNAAELAILAEETAASALLERAAKARRAMLRAYAKRRPMTEVEFQLLVQQIVRCGSICCPTGLAWLLQMGFPRPWAEALNSWAYGELSCHGATAGDIPYLLQKLRTLKRNELP